MASTSLTERIGVNAVEGIFLKEFRWYFREQTNSDFGIDALVEIADDDGNPTGKLIALQIKSGSSYFKKRGEDYVFYGERRHLDYWLKHCLPVFIILRNPSSGVILWQKVEKWKVTITNRGWLITIPPTNILSHDSKQFLAEGIANDPESLRRFYFAADLERMKKYQNLEVFFKIDVWVNKHLNIRGIDIYYDDPTKDEPDDAITVWAVLGDIHEIMGRFFPWLEYDEEEVDDIAGEIESHLLSVGLNKYAKMYLKLEEFFKHEPEEEFETSDDTEPE